MVKVYIEAISTVSYEIVDSFTDADDFIVEALTVLESLVRFIKGNLETIMIGADLKPSDPKTFVVLADVYVKPPLGSSSRNVGLLLIRLQSIL